MRGRMGLVRTEDSEERFVSIMSVKGTNELGTTLTVNAVFWPTGVCPVRYEHILHIKK
jgi:hypothetical protein